MRSVGRSSCLQTPSWPCAAAAHLEAPAARSGKAGAPTSLNELLDVLKRSLLRGSQVALPHLCLIPGRCRVAL